jgi:glutamine amidotransferase
MCRLMAYYGDEAELAETIIWPERSIIKQSYDARERLLDPSLPAHLGHGNLNADGFGIGWYSSKVNGGCGRGDDSDSRPCTFKAITPAWNNENLINLAGKCYSQLCFAHVRAAYPGQSLCVCSVLRMPSG